MILLIDQDKVLESQQIQRENLLNEIKIVEAQNEEIERNIEFTYTLEFVERVAREYFGWVKAGEIKFIEKDGENR